MFEVEDWSIGFLREYLKDLKYVNIEVFDWVIFGLVVLF